MKIMMIGLALILCGQRAEASSCKVYHDECVQEGVLRGNGRIHQCEKEKAEAMNNQACLLVLKKQNARHLASLKRQNASANPSENSSR